MKAHSKQFPIEKMAEVLGVSLNVAIMIFYVKALEDQGIIEVIKNEHKKYIRNFGSPRVHIELKIKEFPAQDNQLQN